MCGQRLWTIVEKAFLVRSRESDPQSEEMQKRKCGDTTEADLSLEICSSV